MNVSKEFLMEAVGLSLLVALLMFGVQMFQNASGLMKYMEERQEETLTRMQEYEIVQYDGQILDGITAISYIKTMVNQYALPVRIETAETIYEVKTGKEAAMLRDSTSEYCMSAFQEYECHVVWGENKNVEYIRMKEKEN